MQVRLLLSMDADMRRAVEGRARRDGLRRDACERRAELFLDRREKLLEAPRVEDIFQPRLVAVGTVAVLDEDAHDGVGHRGRVFRLHHNAGVAREVAMAGDAGERERAMDAGLGPRAGSYP